MDKISAPLCWFLLHHFFLLATGFVAYKRKRRGSINHTTCNWKFKSWIFFSSLSYFRNFFLLPKGNFWASKTWPIRFFDLTSGMDYFWRCSTLDTAGLLQPNHKVLWSYLWCGLLLEVFCFGHYWFTTTECEGQADKRRTKFQESK